MLRHDGLWWNHYLSFELIFVLERALDCHSSLYVIMVRQWERRTLITMFIWVTVAIVGIYRAISYRGKKEVNSQLGEYNSDIIAGNNDSRLPVPSDYIGDRTARDRIFMEDNGHNFTVNTHANVNTVAEAIKDPYSSNINNKQTCNALKNFVLSDSVKQYNCGEIFANNKTELGRALKYRRNTSLRDELYYKTATKNCTQYIIDQGYITEPLNEEEELFPLAFSILMYRDVEQVERLLRVIYRPHNYYCIHVDSKSKKDIYNRMEYIASCFKNVFMCSVRFKVKWGAFSILQPEVQCMKQLLVYSWLYFINLTGMEFPLRTNWELVQILKSLQGANIMKGSFKE